MVRRNDEKLVRWRLGTITDEFEFFHASLILHPALQLTQKAHVALLAPPAVEAREKANVHQR
jgi:hypothetical protein